MDNTDNADNADNADNGENHMNKSEKALGRSFMLKNIIGETEDQDSDVFFVVGESKTAADWHSSNQGGRIGMAEWCPGNGTKYTLLFQPVFGEELVGKLSGGGSFTVLVTWWRPGERSWTYSFHPHGYYARPYIQEKLGGTAEDAWRISQVMAAVLSGKADESGPNGPGVV